MPRLTWGNAGDRLYETGIDRGVLYITGRPGVVWNGLTSVAENPTGGTAKAFYLDGEKYLNVSSSEEFEATIEAFTYPDEFAQCEGSNSPVNGLFLTAQSRKSFGLSYRTKIGNDLSGLDHGYKIHLVYNALAETAQRSNNTINDTMDAMRFGWKITTRAPSISGYKRTAHFVIDSRSSDPLALSTIEDILYGNSSTAARLPTPDELVTLFLTTSSFTVVDHGDGSWTATGTDAEIQVFGDGTFEITTYSAVMIDADSYSLG